MADRDVTFEIEEQSNFSGGSVYLWALKEDGETVATSSVFYSNQLDAFRAIRKIKDLAKQARVPSHPHTGAAT